MTSTPDQFRSQRGASMIEVLVSLTVVAFGLLGLAGLQARSMSFQKDSFDRKTATEMAAQLGERVRGNYDGFKAGNYNLTLTPATATAAVIPACGDVLNESGRDGGSGLGHVANGFASTATGVGRVSRARQLFSHQPYPRMAGGSADRRQC